MKKLITMTLTIIMAFAFVACSGGGNDEPVIGISDNTLNEEKFVLKVNDYKVFKPVEGSSVADEPEIALFMEFTNNDERDANPLGGILQLYVTQNEGKEGIERNDEGELEQGAVGIVLDEYNDLQDAATAYIEPGKTVEFMWSWRLKNMDDPVFCYPVDMGGKDTLEGEMKFEIAGKAE